MQLDPPAAYEYAGYDGFDRFLITWPSRSSPAWADRCSAWRRAAGCASAGRPSSPWSSCGCGRARFAYISQDSDGSSLVSRVLHLLTPYTPFLETNAESNAPPTLVTSYTGSPFWFLVWTVALCGLAATAALLHGADGAVRRTVLAWFAGSAVVAVVALVLGVTTGAQHARAVHARRSVARRADVVRWLTAASPGPSVVVRSAPWRVLAGITLMAAALFCLAGWLRHHQMALLVALVAVGTCAAAAGYVFDEESGDVADATPTSRPVRMAWRLPVAGLLATAGAGALLGLDRLDPTTPWLHLAPVAVGASPSASHSRPPCAEAATPLPVTSPPS